jgi:broad specificity phosphatase PhoE
VDVPLSSAGQRQADALGRWIAEQPEDQRPTVVWCSPYVRAQQTTEKALQAAGLQLRSSSTSGCASGSSGPGTG